MRTKWKTALKFGLMWGLLMTVFSLCFDLREKSFAEIVGSTGFWIRSAGYTIIGIFPVGYFSYQGKEKR